MRINARLDHEIKQDIELLKHHARPEMSCIHLIKCDFARVVHDPKYFDATKQDDGRIMTVHNSELVEIVALA